MTITLNGDSGITTPMYNGAVSANQVTPSVNMKNRIINGAMVIDQRNAGATTTNNGSYNLDRWSVSSTQNTATIGQNYGGVTPPAGFSNYWGLKITSAGTLGSSDYNQIYQVIEGYNIADLNWGTANAKTVTLSFWVYSSVTGTWGGSLRNNGLSRSYPFTYTINSANTWEYKTITIAGDTSGTWNTTNAQGIYLTFSYGAGSTFSGTAGTWASANYNSATGATSIVTTSNATWYMTGVQLEVGSSATSFDYRPYTTELQLAQRYYYVNASGAADLIMCSGYYVNSTNAGGIIPYPVTMRTTPSLVSTTGTDYYKTSTDDNFNSLSNAYGTNQTMLVFNNTQTSGTAGYAIHMRTNSASALVAFSAEL